MGRLCEVGSVLWAAGCCKFHYIACKIPVYFETTADCGMDEQLLGKVALLCSCVTVSFSCWEAACSCNRDAAA